MDWSYNPLIALFFSIEKENNVDSCVYVTWHYRKILNYSREVFKLKKTYLFRPPYVTQRIINQSSVFSIHSDIDIAYENEDMYKLIIKNKVKKELRQMLFKYGIGNKLIYPGLDGVCKDIKWLETKSY